MKKLFTLFAVLFFGCALWSCEYDDDDLWNKVEDLDNRVESLEDAVKAANTNIDALQKLVEAQTGNLTIKSVEKTANGYKITFSNGEVAEIVNGKDGQNGQNGQDGHDGQNGQDGVTPQISVKKDTDGIYYWTINGEWLTDPTSGEKIKAQGVDGQNGENGQDGQNGQNGQDGKPGQDGKDAVAPQLRINPDSKEWEISVDGGAEWTSTGIKAEGKDGDSFFQNVDTSDPNYVVFTLADGTMLRIACEVEFGMAYKGDDTLVFNYEEVKALTLDMAGVADFMIAKPDGWKVALEGNTLTITAPAESKTSAEKVGDVAVHAVSTQGTSKILKLHVLIGRVLTFEDEDYKGSGNMLGHMDWSSMIDTPQNGGPILYGPSADVDASGYFLWDEGNTELFMTICPGQWDSSIKFWNGGYAVSNYVDMNLKHGDPDHQLSVYYKDATTGFGGHNGSKNFGIHFGSYMFADYEPTSQYIPEFYFADEVARVIDHMYVNSTTYLALCAMVGNGFAQPITPDGFVSIEATGLDAEGKIVGKLTFNLMEHGKLVTEWTKWDLSSLGAVVRVKLNMKSSDSGAYGMNTPAYFAFDDVAVRF